MLITCDNPQKKNIPPNKESKVKAIKCLIDKVKPTKISITCKNVIQKKKEKDQKFLSVLYFNKENKRILTDYGQEIYLYTKDKGNEILFKYDHSIIPLKKKEKILHLRTALVDWMIEVLFKYSLSYETFFLTFNIMDLILLKEDQKKIKKKSIHLIGIIAMFIATKIEEVIPISLIDFIKEIGHNNFTKNEILQKEKEFLLSNDSFNDIIKSSLYDYINIFFYDFIVNNPAMNIEDICNDIKSKAIYYSLIMIHFYPSFSLYPTNHKAIACMIMASEDILLLTAYTSQECFPIQKYFIKEWNEFILIENDTTKEGMEPLIFLLKSTIDQYNKGTLRHNLSNFYPKKVMK